MRSTAPRRMWSAEMHAMRLYLDIVLVCHFIEHSASEQLPLPPQCSEHMSRNYHKSYKKEPELKLRQRYSKRCTTLFFKFFLGLPLVVLKFGTSPYSRLSAINCGFYAVYVYRKAIASKMRRQLGRRVCFNGMHGALGCLILKAAPFIP